MVRQVQKNIDCSNFKAKPLIGGRKKRKLKEAGRPYSKTYLDLLMKVSSKTANTVNVKIPKTFYDEEKLNEKGVFTTVGRVAGQYLGDKIGGEMRSRLSTAR